MAYEVKGVKKKRDYKTSCTEEALRSMQKKRHLVDG
jgi:hypothetical protein